MKCLISILLLMIFIPMTIISQTKIGLESLVPPAPNAAEIGKYGTIPVGTLTGVPDISFPLYEIISGELKLPISLSYHASGIQVNQKSTDVGLGWSISAGGIISRTVYSAADNSTYGYFNYIPPSYNELVGINNYYTMSNFNIIGGLGYDLEPDLFVYNIGGKSGKFIFDPDQQRFITIPFEPIKIQINKIGFDRITFQIVDDNGILYQFGQYSQTYSDFRGPRTNISSWYLTSMISANYTDTINFEYEKIVQEDPMVQETFPIGKEISLSEIGGISEKFVFGPKDSPTEMISSNNQYDELLIKKIKFKGGYVQFNRNSAREDTYTSTKMLDEIMVVNNQDRVIKKVEFIHDYFIANSLPLNWRYYRLRLAGYSESDPLQNNKMTYHFEYDHHELPLYGSFDIDYWGYYNGAGNQSLIPLTTVYANELQYISFANGETYDNDFYDPTESWSIGSANREPSEDFMKAAILNKITYPTGGYTLFEYEPHKYESEDLVKKTVTGGGVSYGISKYNKSTKIFNFSFPSDSSVANMNTTNAMATLNINFSASNMANTDFGETQLVTLTNIQTGTSQTWKHEGELTIPYNVSLQFLLLPHSEYTLKHEIYGPGDVSIQSTVTWVENTHEHQIKLGGGLRIKSIKNYTGENMLATSERYLYGSNEDGLGIKLFDERNFYRNYEDVVYSYYGVLGGQMCNLIGTVWQRVFMGVSKYNSINYLGSPILYSKVTKYEIDSSSDVGKTVSVYNINQDNIGLPYEFVNSGNYGSINNSWRQGELISDTVYRNKGGEFLPVVTTTYEYDTYNLESKYALLFKQHRQFVKLSDCATLPTGPEPGSTKYGQGFFSIAPYFIKTGALRKTKETKRVFDPDDINKYITTVTKYKYQNEGNRYLTETEVTNSDGIRRITRLRYPQDISGAVQTAMINRNILTPVLEEKTFKSYSNSEVLLSTIRTNYEELGNLFVKRTIQASTGNNPLETRIRFNQYNERGNLLEQQKADDVKEVFLWGYNQQYPVAKVVGSDFSTVISKISQEQINSFTAIPNNSENVRILLNPLRDIPHALVYTYTYEPLVGMTSETDPSGKTTYYEYDSFGRLTIIRDDDGNILKKICYNYAGQPEACEVVIPSSPNG